MAEIVVLCGDDQKRAFHQSGVRDGSFHGFVYAGRKRVYGSARWNNIAQAWLFTATGKHASLVRPRELVSA